MSYGNQHPRGGGFGFDPNQIFGPQGLLGQVFGNPSGPFGGTGQRDPWSPGGPGGPGHRGHRGPGRRARRGDVRNAVLHLLQREPMNGYQLMQEIAQSSGGAWQPSSGAIYPALALLEDEGLVEQVEVEGRKAYQLTEAGRGAAEGLPRQEWAGGSEPDDPWDEDRRGRRGGRRGGQRGGPSEGGSPFGGNPFGQLDMDDAKARWQRGTRLWKALGNVAMATQAVGQSGDDELSVQAGALLDQTRRDLYRLLAEAEVASDDEDDLEGEEHGDGDAEFAEGEIVDED